MDIFKTIVAGVTVFMLGQIILKLLIDPVHEMKKAISAVRMEMIRTGHILHNSNVYDKETIKAVFDNHRELPARLLAGIELVPFYPVTGIIFGFPSLKKINAASKNLFALSNWMMVNDGRKIGHIIKNSDELIDNLGFTVPRSERFDKNLIEELITSES